MSIGVRRPVRAGLVALLCALAGGLAFGSAAALAAAPMVEGESVVSVKATTATLSAQIDPFGLTTTYEFEYSSDGLSWLKAPEPAGSVSGEGGKTVSAELSGLTAETKYEFRVVAENSAGETGEGVVETFTTAPTKAPELPDGRAFERVSPVENDDAEVYVPLGLPEDLVNHEGEIETQMPFQVATDGEAVAYVGDPTVGGSGNRGQGLGEEYLARRSPGGGWAQANINPPVYSAFYQAFSPNLSLGILQSGAIEEPGAPLLSPQAPGEGYTVLYARSLEGESYRPFFTTAPSNRDPAEFGTAEVPKTSFVAPQQPAFAGASSNYDHLLFEANGAFAGTGALQSSGAGENNLYESVDSQLNLVNILPGGSTEANATFGAKALENTESNPPDFSNVISEDGSRVFWTDLAAGTFENHIFVRENPSQPESPLANGACTVPTDACTVPVSVGPARYWTASADGRYAFYTEGEGEESELYRFDVERGPVGSREVLTAPKAGVEGVLGEGETKSHEYTIYFAATGVLAENQINGAKAESGVDNLYAVKNDGSPIFIAPLSEEDGTQAIRALHRRIRNTGDWQPGLGHRTAEVTPEGGSLVFMSNDQKFDGHYEEVNGQRLEEVYVYDAETESLFCASCARDGLVAEYTREAAEGGLGAFVPISNQLTYQPSVVSADGAQVFFDSAEPLVPADTNGELDVYEWERDGSGACQESDGCVYLLSGGVSESSSFLVGTDATGDNVFMVSREQLVSGPSNGAYDLYDARIGATPVATTACTGTGCQGVPSPPPTFATPPSLTFNGVGNFPSPAPVKPAVKPKVKPLTRAQKLAEGLKACREFTTGRKRAVCDARARKRYGAKSKAKSHKGGK